MAHPDEKHRPSSIRGASFSEPGFFFESGVEEDAARMIAMLEGIIEGSPDLIAVQDPGFRYIAFNRAYQAEFKKVFGVELNLGDNMRDVMAHLPDELASGKEIWGRSLRGEKFTVIREFGAAHYERKSFEIHCSPFRDGTGRVIGAVHVARDVTDRLRAEHALRDSEEEFRLFFESAGGGKAKADPATGRMLRVNDKWCELTGYSREELLGMTLRDLILPAEREKQMALFIRARDSQAAEYSVEKPYLRKDGTVLWVQATAGFLRDRTGKAVRSFVVIQDITSLKRTELGLQQRNERLTLLSEAAAHLLRAENPDTMILELFEKVNRHLDVQIYLNYMLTATGNRMHLDSYAGIPDAAARRIEWLEVGQGICGMAAKECRPFHVTNIQESDQMMVKVVKPFGVRAYAANPLMAGDRLLGTLSFATNTRDRFNEDELEFMRTICQYVAMAKERLRLERELRAHLDRLAEADRRKDEFLAMLAHELRNPLAPIRSAVQVMRLAGTAEPALQRQRDIVDRQVTHMARLLGDLLDVSRITRGKIQFSMKPLALADVVAHALETATPLVEARHQNLYCELPPGHLRVMGDLDRLAQAIGNLLTNASKYTDEGGAVWLESTQQDDQVIIRVRDTGIGIAPEMLSRVFDLFAQADQGLAHSQGGLGIGLTLVRSLVQMHGGSVEARSEGLGKGSEFMIRLPMLAAPGQQFPGAASGGERKANEQAA